MTIEYKGFYATQSMAEGIRIFDKRGVLVYHYLTPNMIFDVYHLTCCVNEYLDHCGINIWRYYDYVKIMIPMRGFPRLDDVTEYVTSHGLFYNNREGKKAKYMDPYDYIFKDW